MRYRGIEFNVKPAGTREDLWEWQFEIDGTGLTGQTQTRMRLMAIRRAELRIDRELARRGLSSKGGSSDRSR